MRVGETQPLLRESIDVRRLQRRRTVSRHIAIAKIVGHDQDDVRFFLGERARRAREHHRNEAGPTSQAISDHLKYPCESVFIRGCLYPCSSVVVFIRVHPWLSLSVFIRGCLYPCSSVVVFIRVHPWLSLSVFVRGVAYPCSSVAA